MDYLPSWINFILLKSSSQPLFLSGRKNKKHKKRNIWWKKRKRKSRKKRKRRKVLRKRFVCVTVLDGIFTFMRNIQILILRPLLLWIILTQVRSPVDFEVRKSLQKQLWQFISTPQAAYHPLMVSSCSHSCVTWVFLINVNAKLTGLVWTDTEVTVDSEAIAHFLWCAFSCLVFWIT